MGPIKPTPPMTVVLASKALTLVKMGSVRCAARH